MSCPTGDDVALRTNPETLSSWILTTQVRRKRGSRMRWKREATTSTRELDRFFLGQRFTASHEREQSCQRQRCLLSHQTRPLSQPPPSITKTTKQHLLAPSARGNLTILLNATCVACKFVQSAVRKVRRERERVFWEKKELQKKKKVEKTNPFPPFFFSQPPHSHLHHRYFQAGLAGVLGLAGGPQNVQGEDQKKLDILANDVFISCLGRSGQVAAMVSEEDDAPIVVEDSTGDYVVVFDPLDGSSNIDCGVSIGTIFGIYRKPDKETSDAAAAAPFSSSSPAAAAEGALRPGRDLVAAGYCLYGSSCMLVLCLGETPPSVFTLDPSLGEFLLTQSCVRVPESGGIYSINEGNAVLWDKGTAEYIDRCKGLSSGGGGGGKEGEKDGKSCEAPKSARYVGSMVADVHRTLLYGEELFHIFCSVSPLLDAGNGKSGSRKPRERRETKKKRKTTKNSPFLTSLSLSLSFSLSKKTKTKS